MVTPTGQPEPYATELKIIEFWPIPDALFDQIRLQIEESIRNQKASGICSPIKIYVDYPLNWTQAKVISQQLTSRVDWPIMILPRVSPTNDSHLIKKEEYTGYYCEFDATIVVNSIEGDRNSIFEIASVHDFIDRKTGSHNFYSLKFPDMEIRGGYYKPELSFKLSRHSYWATGDKIQFTVFCDQQLELGDTYRMRGLLFLARNVLSKKAVVFQEAYMLVDSAIATRDIASIDESFFEKFRGLDIDHLRDATAFPFENSVPEYKSLIFFAVFNLHTAFPFNVLIIGSPGSTKSAFLERLASISGDTLYDSGSATLKGIMPAFSTRGMSAGALAISRHFAIINEFFEIIKSAKKMEGSYDVLSVMKQILEGKRTVAKSGNGSMTVKMRGSVFMATNWTPVGTESRQTMVCEYYSRLDPALLDRFLIYPVPQEEQIKLVGQHAARVEETVNEFCVRSGLNPHTDTINILEKLDTPYRINTVDLRTLLVFKRQINPEMDAETVASLVHYEKEVQKRHGYEIYTRARNFIKLIASAYALARALSDGEIHPTTRTVRIRKEDVRQAAEYYMLVLERHSGAEKSTGRRRSEFANVGVSQGQKFLLEYLKSKYEAGICPEDRKVAIPSLLNQFKSRYPEMDFNLAIRGLLEHHLIVYDGEKAMYLDDWLANDVVEALYGNSPDLLLVCGERLRSASLLQEDSQKNIKCNWITKLPSIPRVEYLEKFMMLLRTHAPRVLTPDEISPVMDGMTQQEVENLLLYLVLAGDIVLDGASVRLTEGSQS